MPNSNRSKVREKIEYYKAKIEKRRCDLERDNACLNNKLIGIITIFGSITLFLLYLLNKDSLIFRWLKNNLIYSDLITFYVVLILLYGFVCVLLYIYYKYGVHKKVSDRADKLNQYFEDDIIKIGRLVGISDEGLEPMERDYDTKISDDVVYSELYKEMRRFRNYELTSSTWYIAIFIAILSILVKIRPNLSNSSPHFFIRLGILLLVLAIGFSWGYSIFYVSHRYRELRRYTTDKVEPKWKNFKVEKLIGSPNHYILITVSLLVMAITFILFWPK